MFKIETSGYEWTVAVDCLRGAVTRLLAKYLLQIFTDGAKVPSVIQLLSIL
ncbi:MAG: hypothetical protein J6K64_06820 [Clostridia bacterium]|nr:hypothetical protein [Clostridia bacterium]